MNGIQRYGLYATGVAIACLIAVHNPTGGYTKAVARYDPWPLPSAIEAVDSHNGLSCDSPTREQRDALTSQKRFLGQELGHCRLVALEFWDWRSNAAPLPYFSTVKKALLIVAAILLGGLSWLWLFRPPQPHELRRKASAKTAESVKPGI